MSRVEVNRDDANYSSMKTRTVCLKLRATNQQYEYPRSDKAAKNYIIYDTLKKKSKVNELRSTVKAWKLIVGRQIY